MNAKLGVEEIHIPPTNRGNVRTCRWMGQGSGALRVDGALPRAVSRGGAGGRGRGLG